MSSRIKHTYGSKKGSFARSSSSALSSSPVCDTSTGKRKRPLQEQSNISVGDPHPPLKRVKTTLNSKENLKTGTNRKNLTQLHFCIDQTILRACSRCGLSYTKGAPDDESLHRTHCARIQKGMEWGREEEKEMVKSGLTPIAAGVRLKDGKKGRIICFRADVGGKMGSKITSLLETINLTLSSPPLTPANIRESKAYLFLLPSSSTAGREKIAGCVIAQRISTAMAIASSAECAEATRSSSNTSNAPTATLIAVDTSTGLFCHPTPLPTPLGISRLFVPSAHRRQGIARHLLSAAADTFIHGCPLDPRKGHVAFTQPTGDGHAVMMGWGGGGVRIYGE